MLKICVMVILAGSLLNVSPATFTERFETNPAQSGWRTFGERSLFAWNSTNQALEVTWDSSYPNSYFYRPLGTVLTRADDFTFSFDIKLHDAAAVNMFEIAVGFLKASTAVTSNFVRGTQMDPLNLVEFDFFPDTGWGASISSILIDTNHNWSYSYMLQDLTPGDWFHVDLTYTASSQNLITLLATNGIAFARSTNTLDSSFGDFRVDTFSISSYSAAGQGPEYPGSILAHGTIDNITIITPGPELIPLMAIPNQTGKVVFPSKTNWFYQLQGTGDLKSWSTVSSSLGNGGILHLADTNGFPMQFYRVIADKP